MLQPGRAQGVHARTERTDTGQHHGVGSGDQAGIEARIRDICATRVRYGYRRVHVMLTREGWDINIKKVYRTYKELGMQLGHKTPKWRVKAKLRELRALLAGQQPAA